MNRNLRKTSNCRSAWMWAMIWMLAAILQVSAAAWAGDTEAETTLWRMETLPQTEAISGRGTEPSKAPEPSGSAESSEAPDAPEATESSEAADDSDPAEPTRPASSEASEMPEPADSSESSEMSEPEGFYEVSVDEIRPDLPAEGRIYDGTDRIGLQYVSKIRRTDSGKKEDPPVYAILCRAHLDGCDVGERQVIYSFELQTRWPDHVKLKAGQVYPELTVEVKKAVLHVTIPDGTKAYMDPPDLEHIRFSADSSVLVTGFVKDSEGREVIPEGYEPPRITVDSQVLKQNSPMYEPQEDEGQEDGGKADSGRADGGRAAEGAKGSGSSEKRKVCRYEAALVLEKTPEGEVTGNPTANYEFCCTPGDERYVPGCVTVTEGEIESGEDYAVTGEEGAYLQDQDRIILRQGSRLYAEPVKGAGYNTGRTSEALSGEGIFTFRLRKKDRMGFVTAVSREGQIRYIADGTAPEITLSAAGVKEGGGFLYSASSPSVSVKIPDDMSGIRSVRYRILKASLTPENLSWLRSSGAEGILSAGAWTQSGSSGSVTLSEEGIFRVEFEATDGVGNSNQARSACIIVDHTAPAVTVDGVSDQGAAAGKVSITASCYDAAYESGSLSAALEGGQGGQIPEMQTIEHSSVGAAVRFADFKHTARADGRYTLTVKARDLAGNETVKTLSFSINRYGSSYGLGKGTKEALKTYYHRQPFSVRFKETNIDEVSSARVVIRRGSSLRELTPGDGTLSCRTTYSSDGYRYVYTVSQSAFLEEGYYEVILFTSDRAGNSSDSASQGIPVRFAVDRTPPQCLITGIVSGERYENGPLTAVAEVRDNLAAAGAWIYKDAVLYRALDGDALSGTEGMIKLSFEPKKEWQTLQICVRDLAGNEYWTTELEFLVAGQSMGGSEAPERKRLTAQQVSLACKWIKTWQGRFRRLFLSHSAPKKAVRRKSLQGTVEAAEGQAAGEMPARSSGPGRRAAVLVLILLFGLTALRPACKIFSEARREPELRSREGEWKDDRKQKMDPLS